MIQQLECAPWPDIAPNVGKREMGFVYSIGTRFTGERPPADSGGAGSATHATDRGPRVRSQAFPQPDTPDRAWPSEGLSGALCAAFQGSAIERIPDALARLRASGFDELSQPHTSVHHGPTLAGRQLPVLM